MLLPLRLSLWEHGAFIANFFFLKYTHIQNHSLQHILKTSGKKNENIRNEADLSKLRWTWLNRTKIMMGTISGKKFSNLLLNNQAVCYCFGRHLVPLLFGGENFNTGCRKRTILATEGPGHVMPRFFCALILKFFFLFVLCALARRNSKYFRLA